VPCELLGVRVGKPCCIIISKMSAKDSLLGRLMGSADKFSDKQVAETLAMLVGHGLKRGASDIHLEPHDRFVLVRYRIDGTLRGIHKLPRVALGSLMAELKKLAGLNTQETHVPQEGDYTVPSKQGDVEVRVATMPVYGGEKAVLHLAVQPGQPDDLGRLGFWGEGLETLRTVMANPHGLVVVAGPRHSGVSSTIFSLVHQLNSPMVSVATVEQRAKHRLPGVNHTYLGKSGLSIVEGLRAALKQDPNIVVVSDLPDRASTEMAIHAATSGHLVVAGLRADNSAGAALRLRVTGVEPFLLISAWRAGIGQRLVRLLCTRCREHYALDSDEQTKLKKAFGMSGPATYKRLHDLERDAARAGLGETSEFNASPNAVTHLWRAKPEGCEHCDHSGFRGRTAIVEVLANTPSLQKGLMDSSVIAASGLQSLTLKDGFVPMALDGLVKALRGLTTVDEVLAAVAAHPLG
jgi:type II secretory ATPase GspE/PulE/Tfp pilus assembly ATPase PilB-like protein